MNKDKFTSVRLLIEEWEKDPVQKAALEKARLWIVRLKRYLMRNPE